jgi:polysaccharide export outer membrane protein
MKNGVVSSLTVILSALLLSNCAILPAAGPSSDSIAQGPTVAVTSNAALPYALVQVSADTAGLLSEPNLVTLKGAFLDKRPRPTLTVGVGDVLNISIFEAAPGGLFTPPTAAGARPGNFVDLPPQAVDQKGSINVPYAGEVPAAGRTLPEIQQSIVARLRNRAIEPQVVVSLNQQHSTVASVLGAVNTPGVLALNTVGERMLSVIARAGGPKFEAIESYVTLQRDGKRVRVLLSRIVQDPRENIFVRPNDTIFVSRESPNIIALGATGVNANVAFDSETLTLSQALGKAGGLIDTQADAAQVFVYRFENRDFLSKLGVDTQRFAFADIPTVYHINLRDPSGMLLASGFQMRSKDVMFVANAKVIDYYKLIDFINATTSTVRNVNAASREVSTPWNR